MVSGKNPLEKWWTDRLDLWVRQPKLDPKTGRTVFVEEKIAKDIPCRISHRMSFETVRAARDKGEIASTAHQAVKVFLSPEVTIPPGSRMDINRQGKTLQYTRSGVPAVFDRHQEIRLERFERWV